MAAKLWYIGEGILLHKDEKIRSGDVLPADLPEKTIEGLKRRKAVSTTDPKLVKASPAGSGDDDLKKQIAEAKKAIAQLTAENEKLTADLIAAQDALTFAQEGLAAANKTVEQLTIQLTAGKPTGGDKAGPK